MDGFVITDADAAQARAEREATALAMLAEADYADYLADAAEQLAAEVAEEESAAPAPRCRECGGSGTRRFSTGFGLSDWIDEPCPFCRGTAPVPTPLVVTPRLYVVAGTAAARVVA